MASANRTTDARRRGGWLPEHQEGLEAWLVRHVQRTEERQRRGALPHPVVSGFRELLDTDPVLRMLLQRAVEEEPRSRPYRQRHVQDVDHLLRLLDTLLTTAPEFSEEAMVMTPVAAVLDWPMSTPTGFAAFRDPRVNAWLRDLLRAWCEFLDSPGSRYVLTGSPAGWFAESARATTGMDQYEHDPDAEHGGFSSWNDFFTRRFREGERPVAAPDDDSVVVSACESTPYAFAQDVQLRDRFWVKAQPYSVQDLLAGDAAAEEFVGGSVYQAYLSATDYHPWHAPVAGTVVRSSAVPGTYYSEADSEGPQAGEPQESQGYLAHVSARAVVLLQADDPRLGLVGFVAVGMADVSSCVVRPDLAPGDHVAKGEELGHFQFGGSTWCLLLRPGVVSQLAVAAVPRPDGSPAPVVRVGSHLLTVG